MFIFFVSVPRPSWEVQVAVESTDWHNGGIVIFMDHESVISGSFRIAVNPDMVARPTEGDKIFNLVFAASRAQFAVMALPRFRMEPAPASVTQSPGTLVYGIP